MSSIKYRPFASGLDVLVLDAPHSVGGLFIQTAWELLPNNISKFHYDRIWI